MLWQLAYSELYFTDKLWPEFGEGQTEEAITSYQGRERRYGRTSEQVLAADPTLRAPAMLKARVVTALILLAGLLSSCFLLPALGWLLFVLAGVRQGRGGSRWGAMVGFARRAGRVYAVLLGLLCLAGGLVAGLHLPASVAPFALAPVCPVGAVLAAVRAVLAPRALEASGGRGCRPGGLRAAGSAESRDRPSAPAQPPGCCWG